MNWLKRILQIKKGTDIENEAELEPIKWVRKDPNKIDKDMPTWLVRFLEKNERDNKI